jgi:MarR family transcriptional regulator, organic hydroperoxide resistance regulator
VLKESSFGFAKPEDSPGFLLWQTTMSWQRLIKKALEPYEVSHAQFVLLALLLWFEECGEAVTQVTLVKWSKLDKMTVSISLKKLVSRGLVERHEHKTDTRAKTVLLTDAGRVLIKQLVPVGEAVDDDFFAGLGKPGVHTLIRCFNQLME